MLRLAITLCLLAAATFAGRVAITTPKERDTPVPFGHDTESRELEARQDVTEPCQCGVFPQSRIAGGTNAEAGWFPSVARVVEASSLRTLCGGSVINDRYILTSYLCTWFIGQRIVEEIKVMLGDLRPGTYDPGEETFSVARIISHPSHFEGYNIFDGYDFALMRLGARITYSDTIGPACLPAADQTFVGASGTVAGYGIPDHGQPAAAILKFLKVTIRDNRFCEIPVNPYMLCAGGFLKERKGLCAYDIGNQLLVDVSNRTTLAGVASFGHCGRGGKADIYGRVSSILDFIERETSDAHYCEG